MHNTFICLRVPPLESLEYSFVAQACKTRSKTCKEESLSLEETQNLYLNDSVLTWDREFYIGLHTSLKNTSVCMTFPLQETTRLEKLDSTNTGIREMYLEYIE